MEVKSLRPVELEIGMDVCYNNTQLLVILLSISRSIESSQKNYKIENVYTYQGYPEKNRHIKLTYHTYHYTKFICISKDIYKYMCA